MRSLEASRETINTEKRAHEILIFILYSESTQTRQSLPLSHTDRLTLGT